jgi:hypothetical protein
MKEFTIGAVIGFLLIGYGLYVYYSQGQTSGYAIVLIGAAVIFIAHRLSGKFFKQPVPNEVVRRILQLAESGIGTGGPLVTVPYSSRGLEQLSEKALDLSLLAMKIKTAYPNVGLALSKRYQIVFVNPEAVRAVIKQRSVRTIVNDWHSFRGAMTVAGFDVVDVQ